MDRQDIMEMLADWFGIEPNEDGKFDIDDYEWQAGCYPVIAHGIGGRWLNLATIVECLEENL